MLSLDFNNDTIKKNGANILSVLAIIALFFPILTIDTGMNMFGVSASDSRYVNGLDLVFGEDMLWLFLLIAPVALLATPYVDILKKYEYVLSVVIPIVALLIIIQTFLFFGSFGSSGGFVDIEVGVSLGGYFILACYVGIITLNAMKFGYSLNKDGAKMLKENVEEAIKENRNT